MIFGAFVPQGWKREFDGFDARRAYETMLEVAGVAERAGYDSLWLYDHFHNVPPPPVPTPVFECWTSMMALAAATERARLGQMVTCTPYRNAGHLAKIAASVDVASNGRLEMGLGAGWYEHEYLAYGYGFPPPKERIGYLADTVEILTRMWTEEAATYDGRYARVDGALCDPKPLQKPRPPLWIGGGGEQLTLKVVAKHADYSNWSGKPDVFAHKRDVLRAHCDSVGRDPSGITMTAIVDCLVAETDAELTVLEDRHPSIWGQSHEERRAGQLVGTTRQVIDRVGELQALGAGGLILWFADAPSTASMELFASAVAPVFR